MKSLKIWSLAVMLVLAAVGCDKESENIRVTLNDIVGEWHLVEMNNKEVPFSVYIVFNDDESFDIYQQVYELSYVKYSGNYTLEGAILEGSYLDGYDWKNSYKVSIQSSPKCLILKGDDEVLVYEPCAVPDDVKAEAEGTRAIDAERHL